MRWRSPDFWSGLALAALGGYIVVAALVALGVVAGFYLVFPLALGVALP